MHQIKKNEQDSVQLSDDVVVNVDSALILHAARVGLAVGIAVGITVGIAVGISVGAVGTSVGTSVGVAEGSSVVGFSVGVTVGVGYAEGAAVVLSERVTDTKSMRKVQSPPQLTYV